MVWDGGARSDEGGVVIRAVPVAGVRGEEVRCVNCHAKVAELEGGGPGRCLLKCHRCGLIVQFTGRITASPHAGPGVAQVQRIR